MNSCDFGHSAERRSTFYAKVVFFERERKGRFPIAREFSRSSGRLYRGAGSPCSQENRTTRSYGGVVPVDVVAVLAVPVDETGTGVVELAWLDGSASIGVTIACVLEATS